MLQTTIMEAYNLTHDATYAYFHLQRNIQGFMIKSAVLLMTTCILFLSINGCRAADQASAAMRTWDKILTSHCFEDVAKFNRTIRQQGNQRIFMFSTFSGNTVNGKVVMSIVVAVKPAGKGLDPEVWKKAFSVATAKDKINQFPEIGIRALEQVPTFSPDGALSGVLFTTSDELFDVQVSFYESSSAAPGGSLTADKAVLRIEQAYLGTFH